MGHWDQTQAAAGTSMHPPDEARPPPGHLPPDIAPWTGAATDRPKPGPAADPWGRHARRAERRPGRYRSPMIRIWLGHGASGDAASMAPWVDGLTALGIEAHALQLPRRRAEDAVAALEAQVPDEAGIAIGGHSFGGRVASLAVAGVRVAEARPRNHPYAGLVCLSYPLHRPGAPETAGARTAHWPAISVPALLLSGSGDPFARIDLLEASMPLLPSGRLVTYPRLGHGLRPVLDDALGHITAFLRSIEAA